MSIPEYKYLTQDLAIKDAPLPDKVYLPLAQHVGKPCNVLEVKPGDVVRVGQRLAVADGGLFAPLHSSVSGKVVAVQDYYHPVLSRTKAVVIQRDAAMAEEGFSAIDEKEVSSFTPQKLREIIRDAGVVGMGGAAFPAHIKLSPPQPVDSFILNGAECEPYLNSDNRLMIENAREILQGVRVIVKILGVKNAYIAIEDNKPRAIREFRKKIGYGKSPALKVLETKYPQGAEKQLIYSVLRRRVPAGKLPFDVGVVVHNVATAFAIFEAVYKRKPLYERIVTVTGEVLERPGNLRVRLGTPIKDLIAVCGPLRRPAKKIIMGGPMMGLAQPSDEVPVIKGTSGVVLLADDDVRARPEKVCLRCGKCVRNCPMGLRPALISIAASQGKWGLAKEYGALNCVECGLCAYNCPANRNVVQWVRQVKRQN
ncbi:MAG: electron transport complex subunit RsxC [Candidatus Omnitrophota bacterium]